ncbi:Uncharacterized protein HZ326_11683 [Fusarium oxysporum f. sp. albedinis]|nr:Uncharacterized protein HZ326_11683 [Fusarium oxysporum f. sp. albedinis]
MHKHGTSEVKTWHGINSAIQMPVMVLGFTSNENSRYRTLVQAVATLQLSFSPIGPQSSCILVNGKQQMQMQMYCTTKETTSRPKKRQSLYEDQPPARRSHIIITQPQALASKRTRRRFSSLLNTA